MDRNRWTVLCLALFVAGLMVVGSPRSTAAALDDTRLYAYQDDSGTSVPPDQPLLAVPGIFSFSLGQGFSSRDGVLALDSAEVDLPVINATATVNGFTFGLRDQSYGWDSITLNQAAPMGNEAVTISDLQANVGGKTTNYSTDLSTTIDVHPGEALQASATVGLSYDGLTGQASFGVTDGAAQVAVGPATLAVDGLNVANGAVAVDTVQVVAPEAGVGVRLDGFQVVDGQADWQALTWVGQEFKLGDVATISNSMVVVPGPSAPGAAPIGATTRVDINGGDAVQTGGQFVFTYDRVTGQPSLSLLDGSAQFGVAGWTMAFDGVNAGQKGASVDTMLLTAEPLGVQVQVNGLAVDDSSGLTFDQARVLYQPDPASGQAVAGFELVVDSTDAGYVVTTTTLLPTAKAK